MITKIAFAEPECGRPSMKSMEMTVQAELGTGNG
jgi:hypothetical protein